MKAALILYIMLASAFFIHPALAQEASPQLNGETPDNPTNAIPEKAQRLMDAYPEMGLKYTENQIVFPDGTAIPFDDGKTKDFITMMNDSDIEDMFSMPYTSQAVPGYLQDAGRSRCETFFKKMYGRNAKSVQKNLVTVSWFGQKIKFSKINGAAAHLQEVGKELAEHPELKPYMKASGTYYWRKVRGADRLSAHSYGIAIDIAVKQSDYWKWGYPKAKETDEIGYKNRIPMEIVEIFENHGFIWGGRWYHYDTMHFEYRPELAGK